MILMDPIHPIPSVSKTIVAVDKPLSNVIAVKKVFVTDVHGII